MSAESWISSRVLRGAPLGSGVRRSLDKEMGATRVVAVIFHFTLLSRERRAGDPRSWRNPGPRPAVEWLRRTSSRSLRNSRTCARVMRKGGKRRSRKIVGAIDQQTALQGLADKWAAFDGEFDADHQAFAAYGTNKIEFSSELGETFAQFGAAREDIFEKIFILDNAEKFQRGWRKPAGRRQR